jgi:hypothetical protein
MISMAVITTAVAFTRHTDILGTAMAKSISTHSIFGVLCLENSISSMKFLNGFCIFWQSKNINSVYGA